jgi:hypothetical protein
MRCFLIQSYIQEAPKLHESIVAPHHVLERWQNDWYQAMFRE